MKRPRLPRLPRPSRSRAEAAATTTGFFGGLLIAAIGVGMVYLPAGLIVGGLFAAGLAALLARSQT